MGNPAYYPIKPESNHNEGSLEDVMVEVYERERPGAGWDMVGKSTIGQAFQNPSGNGCRLVFGERPMISNMSLRSPRLDKILPHGFARATRWDSNGGFGCKTHFKEGRVEHVSWFCFKIKQILNNRKPEQPQQDPVPEEIKYRWLQIHVLISWDSENKVSSVLCLGAPDSLREEVRKVSIDARDPYEWHHLVIDEVLELYDQSVWGMRDLVRAVEQNRSHEANNEDFKKLHEIARHIIHSNETLEVAVGTMDCIQKSDKMLKEQVCKQIANEAAREEERRIFQQTFQDLVHLQHGLQAILIRSRSLYDRLQNEINLGYNLVSQRDSQTSVELAKSAKVDNMTMKTIAIVTLIFLPGTYISALFGMNFFDFSEDDSGRQAWLVSDNFWLYWAITIPVTALCLLSWWVWDWRQKRLQTGSGGDGAQSIPRRRYLDMRLPFTNETG